MTIKSYWNYAFDTHNVELNGVESAGVDITNRVFTI